MATGNLPIPEKIYPKPESDNDEQNNMQPSTIEGSFTIPEQQPQILQPEEQKSSVPDNAKERLAIPEQQSYTEPTEETIDSKIDVLKRKLRLKKKKVITIPRVKDELTVRIEKVMEEGLGDAYKELSLIQQQEFKIKGEETAWQIRQILKNTHVKIKAIFKLLLEWLKMLPGINRFFLEQEAKIKADKILTIKNYHQEK